MIRVVSGKIPAMFLVSLVLIVVIFLIPAFIERKEIHFFYEKNLITDFWRHFNLHLVWGENLYVRLVTLTSQLPVNLNFLSSFVFVRWIVLKNPFYEIVATSTVGWTLFCQLRKTANVEISECNNTGNLA